MHINISKFDAKKKKDNRIVKKIEKKEKDMAFRRS